LKIPVGVFFQSIQTIFPLPGAAAPGVFPSKYVGNRPLCSKYLENIPIHASKLPPIFNRI
jgi:hypothetical protein